MNAPGPQGDSAVERYLDEIVSRWTSGNPRELRALLAEAETHLHEDTARGVASGMSQAEAETAAVRRFGPARDLVAADRRRVRTPVAVLARQLVGTAVLLGSVGALTVGASGVLAAGIRWLGGARILAGPALDRALAPTDCARWMALHPAAADCRAAATADWANEVVFYRIVIGVLGALALLLLILARRRSNTGTGMRLLPSPVANTIALTLFGLAGIWTLGMGLDAVAVSAGDGSGQWLSAAPVALLAAGYYGARLLRDLREPSPN
jgi:hypothetical protein